MNKGQMTAAIDCLLSAIMFLLFTFSQPIYSKGIQ